jgi:hypothetical protein
VCPAGADAGGAAPCLVTEYCAAPEAIRRLAELVGELEGEGEGEGKGEDEGGGGAKGEGKGKDEAVMASDGE